MLFSSVQAHVMLTSQYLSQNECKVSPDVMYTFYIDNPDATSQGATDYWPFLFIYPHSLCGDRSFPVEDCCYNFPDNPYYSTGYKSAMSHLADDSDPLVNAPANANGKTFCRLEALDGTSVFGYLQGFYQNNNQCLESTFRCSSTGLLSVYNYTGFYAVNPICPGTPIEQFNLANPGTFQSSVLGKFRGSLYTINQGSRKPAWIAEYAHDGTPDFTKPANAWSITAFGISLLLCVVFIVKTVYKIVVEHVRSRFVFMQGFMVSTICVYVCVSLYLWYIPLDLTNWPDIYKNRLLGSIGSAVLSLVFLQTTIITNSVLVVNILLPFNSKLTKAFTFLCLILINIGLGGANYFNLYALRYTLDPRILNPYPDPEFGRNVANTIITYNRWKLANPYNELFAYFFNSVPPLLVCYKLIQNGKKESVLTNMRLLASTDSWTVAYMLMQLSFSFGYLILVCIRDYTLIPGGDLNATALVGSKALLITLHVCGCILLGDSMKRVNEKTTTARSGWGGETSFAVSKHGHALSPLVSASTPHPPKL